MKYNKLVRDNVPKQIEEKGEKAVWHIAENEEFWIKLKEKLLEEVHEFIRDESAEELADVLEVIEAIIEVKRFAPEEVESVRKQKAEIRGKFKKRIVLDES